jgi:hypothetical protein
MLDLVREFISEEAYEDVRKRYEKFRVPHKPKRGKAAKARAAIAHAISAALYLGICQLEDEGFKKGRYFVSRPRIDTCSRGFVDLNAFYFKTRYRRKENDSDSYFEATWE